MKDRSTYPVPLRTGDIWRGIDGDKEDLTMRRDFVVEKPRDREEEKRKLQVIESCRMESYVRRK
jgi:hypothetical protein